MEPSAELQGVIRSWFEAVAGGDATWLDRHLSTDERLRTVGTDPAEWLRGQGAADLLKADLAVLGGKATVRVGDVEAFSEGSVGWGVARPEITLEDGTTVSPRWIGVFHREGGEWKAVQVHASIGQSNEQAFGARHALDRAHVALDRAAHLLEQLHARLSLAQSIPPTALRTPSGSLNRRRPAGRSR